MGFLSSVFCIWFEKSFAIKFFFKIRLLGEIYYFNIGLGTASTGSGSLWISESSLATSLSNPPQYPGMSFAWARKRSLSKVRKSF